MLDSIILYFAADPLKILYVLGGAGGVWFWLERWLDRIRLRVRLVAHSFDTIPDGMLRITTQFEVVNVGKSPTSLEPYVFCVGYSVKRKREYARLAISNVDRILPPHSTRTFTAIGETDPTYPWWHFKAFRLSPTRGKDRVIYSRSSPRKAISWLRYDFELTLFRQLGWLPFVRGNQSDG